MKSAFLLSKGLLCLYDKQNNTWFLVDMEFLFSCLTRHLTRSLRSLVSYRVKQSKRNSISSRAHVLFSIYHINCGVIQRFPALRKVVTTHVKNIVFFSTRVDIANQMLTRTRLWRHSVSLMSERQSDAERKRQSDGKATHRKVAPSYGPICC